ncbi:hypothetical protein BBD31_01360 [Elizabethkingia anophelis]|uniref:hypothetical protein n=1 Tax=Elizabethkingia anophelis TaxID=1117645 RepID=UPI000994CAFE|nr:hypothetical protein [Elizabethkingia anophelis]AQW96623.1 hypothetical protein BBD31_01360 [Elizabethkingia anophelis]MDV3673617.1 hypothetical protein [Elizabethkingia anophelis]MDV3692341.1 hypothetical protein [Elizabethkingia anophelis]MDV3706506.1 hypothetical protein [Elizabethkingia anophelis]OPB50128.1 hypothetical protein BAY04_07145 [Elizabethkingia anophelis]
MDIRSLLVEYFIDDPEDIHGYMNDAFSLVAGEAIKKGLEFNGYFKTKYQDALRDIPNFDEDYFANEDRIKLYVLLSALQDKEIMQYLSDIYTVSQQLPPSEEEIIKMSEYLLDNGVEF